MGRIRKAGSQSSPKGLTPNSVLPIRRPPQGPVLPKQKGPGCHPRLELKRQGHVGSPALRASGQGDHFCAVSDPLDERSQQYEAQRRWTSWSVRTIPGQKTKFPQACGHQETAEATSTREGSGDFQRGREDEKLTGDVGLGQQFSKEGSQMPMQGGENACGFAVC